MNQAFLTPVRERQRGGERCSMVIRG